MRAEGFAAKRLSSGAMYAAIHYTADEDKRDPAVVSQMKKAFVDGGQGQSDWNREMELVEEVWPGTPVFPDFSMRVHCPPALLETPYPLQMGSSYIAALDAGQTLHPACTLFQISPQPVLQIAAVLEITSTLNIGGRRVRDPQPMVTFMPRCIRAFQQLIPRSFDDIEWVGDQTITTRDGGRGETALDVMRSYGVHVRPMTNNFEARSGAVTWALNDWIEEGAPRFFVSGYGCPVLLEGFQGAYHWQEKEDKPHVHVQQPEKNLWSDPMDACQYGLMRAREFITGRSTKRRKSRS